MGGVGGVGRKRTKSDLYWVKKKEREMGTGRVSEKRHRTFRERTVLPGTSERGGVRSQTEYWDLQLFRGRRPLPAIDEEGETSAGICNCIKSRTAGK